MSKPNIFRGRLRYCWWLALALLLWGVPAAAQTSDPSGGRQHEAQRLLAQTETGGMVRVIVGLNVPYQQIETAGSAQAAAQQATIQQAQFGVLSGLPGYDASSVTYFDHIPYMALSVNEAGLEALLRSGLVTTVYEDRRLELFLENSIALTGTDLAWDMGYDGSGQTVAILDTGVDKNHPFVSGRVVAEACFSFAGILTENGQDFTFSSVCPNGQQQQIGAGTGVPCSAAVSGCYHGTHVAGIAAGKGAGVNGVARRANIIAVQVVSTYTCDILGTICPAPLFSNVVEGLLHVYDLSATYDIAAVNLSLGTGNVYPGNCDADFPAEKAAIDLLTAAGIAVIAASGNGDANGLGYTNGISSPACITNAVSVGATSADPGTADRFASFSNSSSALDLLAPGLNILASIPGGSTMEILGGTSMAAPHVAGAWAIMKQAAPNAPVSEVLTAFQNSGVPLTDPRNAIVTPRIQVDAAAAALTGDSFLTPPHDNPANALPLALYNSTQTLTRYATTTAGVPALPANCGGSSNDIWYRYQATAAQNIAIDTRESTFNTIVAVWTGWPNAPILVGCNDDAGGGSLQSRLIFNSTPGTTYYFQVSGKNNASGMLRFVAEPTTFPDDFANAKPLAGVVYRDGLNTDTTTAPASDPQPSCIPAQYRPLNTVWYRYTPATTQQVLIDTVGSDFNTLLSVWTGSAGALSEAACHDDVSFNFFLPESTWILVSKIQMQMTAGTTYYIMASGKQAFFTNDPSGNLKLNLTVLFGDVPLDAPLLVAPGQQQAIDNPEAGFRWSSTLDTTGYDIQIGLTNPPTSSPVRVNSVRYTSPPLSYNTFYWRVRSVRGAATSAWSEIHTFSVVGLLRNLFTTATPTLSWSGVTWAESYEIQVASDPQFTGVVFSRSAISERFVVIDALPNGRYYWRVRAKRSDGSFGNWSQVDGFTINAP